MKSENCPVPEKGKVFFRHIRNINDDGTVSNRGGATVAYQEVKPGLIRVAMALCSNRDNFCRKTGRTIAGGRMNSQVASGFIETSWENFIKSMPYTMDDLEYEMKRIEG